MSQSAVGHLVAFAGSRAIEAAVDVQRGEREIECIAWMHMAQGM